ncbi:ADP-ribosyl cyclase/cyclic ADP-ribose hydrolase 1 isoform X2 [Brienomyrus brachyistius]|uniref:ADP-ribosyl cyclase/cyclic ADP-ribose hydrolase 1 isoform X2 n=1 Tax=Brienomyrus brachyistius TaxID=42636 RepID=UPI0020B2211A|nr:ADP-ribosyl cyclase/cyclic ADP-ribose hydrolase 1 isoform X2 [Brienomyrus brachyistius]
MLNFIVFRMRVNKLASVTFVTFLICILSLDHLPHTHTHHLPAALVLLLFFDDLGADVGTTPNLKQIVLGRCFSYVTLISPGSRFNCEEIWREFRNAVIQRAPCDVRVKDYSCMFHAAPQALPCDRLLFWSKTREFVHSYSAITRRFCTLEDTLVGYMFNDLIWCGQKEKHRGFDFNSCPEWSTCANHPVYSLWKQASQNFAASACGNITVILNGSMENAFNRTSMFGSVELDSLNPRMVNHVNIKVVANLEGPIILCLCLCGPSVCLHHQRFLHKRIHSEPHPDPEDQRVSVDLH